jgi:hypothetical protein
MITEVPSDYEFCDYLKRAYLSGWSHSADIASFNFPKIGEEISTSFSGFEPVTVTEENVKDIHMSLSLDAEENSRQYSPFEFLAREFNDYGEGGFIVKCIHEETMEDEIYGPFENDVEAEEFAKGIGEGVVEEIPCADEMWLAFEVGMLDRIEYDIGKFKIEDYQI